MKAYLIKADGTKQLIDVPTGSSQLRVLQGHVGGYLEAQMSEDRNTTFFINEEGKIHGLPVNKLATAYWWLLAPYMAGHDVLSGDVVVIGGHDSDGEMLPLTDEVERLIRDTYVED